MAQARQARDWKDTQTLLSYLQERNRFTFDPSLRSICTGVHAHSTVNVDTAKSVGNAILASMEGTTAVDFTFKRSDQVVALDTKSAVKIDGVIVQIDPQLLFQRLTIASKYPITLKTSSIMSSAVIHKPSLIHHCCLESYRNQYSG